MHTLTHIVIHYALFVTLATETVSQLTVLFYRYILSRVDICEGQGLVYMWRPTWGFAS